MIDHVSIGVRDIAKAKAFYDAALKPLGYACLSPGETSLGYGGDAARFWLNLAESPLPPDTKSGLHFCFAAPSRESVGAFRAVHFGKTEAEAVELLRTTNYAGFNNYFGGFGFWEAFRTPEDLVKYPANPFTPLPPSEWTPTMPEAAAKK